MATANNFLTPSEVEQVEAAIAAAEKQTSAEIVCVVATESGRYDRAEAVVGLFTGLLLLLLANLLMPLLHRQLLPVGDWNEPSVGLAFVEQAVAVLIGFVAGNVLASYWHGLRRLFVRTAQMDAETERAANFVFAARRLTSTRHAGGLLLYVSLFEHRVIVLADQGVMDALGQGFLDQIRDTAVAKLRSGNATGTLVESVQQAAEQLATALPHTPEDNDELPNTFVRLHPRP